MAKEENTIFCLQGMNGNIEEMIRFMIILHNSIKMYLVQVAFLQCRWTHNVGGLSKQSLRRKM
jgi:hypothetical protein